MHLAHILAEISWDPAIRNILALMVGIGVLMGSIILIVSTNAGPRTGLLVVLGCLFGWMTIMGVVWWMYGIGMKGDPSHWRAIEVNRGNLAKSELAQATRLPQYDDPGLAQKILQDHPELETKVNPDGTAGKVITVSELIDADPTLKDQYHLTPNDLGGWRILVPSDKQRGDAQAIADEELTTAGPNQVFKLSSDYKVIDAFDIGGKRQLPSTVGDCKFYKPSTWGDCKEHAWDDVYSFVQFSHPEHYAIVQVQAVVAQVTPPGAAPPTPKLDPNAPVVSVIMIRSLGDLRFPAFMVTVVFGILFFLTCWTLHRRDKIVAANRSAG